MAKKHVNEQLHTNLANTGRIAGCGMNYDRYDDESGRPNYEKKHGGVSFPSDYLSDEELQALNGPVICRRGITKH